MAKKVEEKKTVLKKRLQGTVVSDANDKTIVVAVDTLKAHPKYKKRYKVTNKYHAHDPKNEFKVGDTVTIIHSRPISKNKNWRVEYQAKK